MRMDKYGHAASVRGTEHKSPGSFPDCDQRPSMRVSASMIAQRLLCAREHRMPQCVT